MASSSEKGVFSIYVPVSVFRNFGLNLENVDSNILWKKIIFTFSFINIGFLTTMPFCACASVCDFGQREEREKKNLMSNSLIFKCTTCVHISSSFKIKSSTRSGELFPCSEPRCDGQI